MRENSPTLQLVLSLLGALALFTGAFLFVIFGVMQLFTPTAASDPASAFLWAGSLAFAGLLVLPSAYYAVQVLRGKPARWNTDRRWVTGLSMFLLLVVLPFVLLVGHWISSNPRIAWLLLPPLHVLAVAIPVYWTGSLALRDLPVGSPRRFWGIFAASLTATPFSILVLELVAMLLASVAAVLALSTQPDLVRQLSDLINRLQFGILDEQALQELLRMLTGNPAPILMVVAFVAIVVPLIEETLKPLALWLLVRRSLSPAEGFALGVLCGTAYALFESLFLTTSGPGWSTIVLARIGTAALHILTTALTGWGLALAWGQKNYRRMALQYGLAVFLHAAWNALSTLNVAAAIIPRDNTEPAMRLIQTIGTLAPAGLVLLFIGCFAALLVLNRRLAKESVIPTVAVESAQPLSEPVPTHGSAILAEPPAASPEPGPADNPPGADSTPSSNLKVDSNGTDLISD